MSKVEVAKRNAAAMIIYPPRMTSVAERIGSLCGEKLDVHDLHELSRLLDKAAFCADGPGLSGVLVGLMAGLELAHGVERTEPVAYCRRCTEPMHPGQLGNRRYCSEDCARKQRAHDRYHGAKSSPEVEVDTEFAVSAVIEV